MFGLALHGESKGYLFLYYVLYIIYHTYIYNAFFLHIYTYIYICVCVWPHISIHIYNCIIYTYDADFLYAVCTYSPKLSRGFAVNVEQDGLGNAGSEPSGWQKLTKEMVFVDHIPNQRFYRCMNNSQMIALWSLWHCFTHRKMSCWCQWSPGGLRNLNFINNDFGAENEHVVDSVLRLAQRGVPLW